MRILFAIFALVAGLGLLAGGYRFARIFLPVMGFVFGLSIGGAIVSDANGTTFLATFLGIAIGLVLGVLFAVLAYFYYYLAVVLACVGFGYWAGSSFVLLLGFSPGILSLTIGIALGLLTGLLAAVSNTPKYLLIFITSLIGASFTIGGALLLFNQIPLDTFSYATVNVALSNSFLWSMVGLALVAFGVFTQSVANTGANDFERWGMDDEHTHYPHPPNTNVPRSAH